MAGIERQVLRALGVRIRDARRGRHLTQATLAEAVKVTTAYVSLIERGRRNPPYTTVVQIARALGIPASELVHDAPAATRSP